MLVMGIDPGSLVTGFGIVEYNHPNINLVSSGCIKTRRSESFDRRLKIIFEEISSIIKKFNPEQIALEEVFYSINVKTALQIGHVRGVALLAASLNNVNIVEYTPRMVKQAVTGNGGASKEQVQFMVQKILRSNSPSIPFDVSDALATAICHCHRYYISKSIDDI